MIKPRALSAPFERAFEQQRAMGPPIEGERPEEGELMSIKYREDEAIYIKASSDRVTVVFSTMFKDETDRVFGRVFLQVGPPSLAFRQRMTANLGCMFAQGRVATRCLCFPSSWRSRPLAHAPDYFPWNHRNSSMPDDSRVSRMRLRCSTRTEIHPSRFVTCLG